ncbi:uncharacterized protein METZ01_LOCUS71002 [marine metagenome]|uniref:Aminoglycoside phosphotransferase domain-containing protein n=1 Tax=marine metagenome TaxID=408172 RepID=A0A381TRL2_9ZZZZ|tara:strand:+ start:686 stop:1594 length:909 start_codon:yes stop_codon:yes gene_type:complete
MELSIANAEKIVDFSIDRGWLHGQLRLAEIAGEGNMNRTLRIVTDADSIVLKQSVPFVAKYPDIPAPIDRDRVEAAFYQALEGMPIASKMPRFLGHAPEYHLLAFEDLGPASDCTDAYSGMAIDSDIPQLLSWLRDLHQLHIESPVFTNRDMRKLNHAHIFEIPFEDHGSPDVAQRAKELGNAYLSDGPTLLHGDYYPGSWLRTTQGIRIIDPEFAFTGAAEFDVGVFAAHLAFTGLDDAAIRKALGQYQSTKPFDLRLALGFAGVEVLRRLWGIAKLPLPDNQIDRESVWIEWAIALVLDG